MKKILFTALSALAISGGIAQNDFFTKTCYRGAFAPSPAPMWTDNWTEWDPQNKVYPTVPTITVTQNITSNTTWPANSVVLLSTQCFVKSNSILTIAPGVVVLGDKNVTGAGLIITKGSQLIANGTASSPIVFTSNQAPGQRNRGDWGGIILLGKATNNTPGGINYVEGLAQNSDTEFGVSSNADDNDNSGSLSYLRLEFGGYAYQQDKEINGFTFGAIGKATMLHHLQCSFNQDDAFEWFGGNVNAKYLVSYRNLDDDFDTDFGYSGNVQFGLAVRDPQFADNPSISTSEFFESDNNATGTAATPLTSGIFSNMTCIGPLRGVSTGTYASGHRSRVRIRRNSALKVYNSIFTDQATRGVFIDGSASETNASTGALKFKNNILAGYGQRATESGTFGIINANAFVIANANDTLGKLINASNILVTPYNYTSPDYRPSAGSIALSNASFTDAAIAAVSNQTFVAVTVTIPTDICIANESSVVTSTAYFSAGTTIPANYCSLSWSVSPGVTISSTVDPTPSFSISTLGTFTIYLNVSTANGNVTEMRTISTSTCTNVGLNEAANQIGLVKVFPNPTSSDEVTLKINANSALNLNVNITDVTGKIVAMPVNDKNINAGENNILLNTANLNNGIYFVTILSNNVKETVKLIVNK